MTKLAAIVATAAALAVASPAFAESLNISIGNGHRHHSEMGWRHRHAGPAIVVKERSYHNNWRHSRRGGEKVVITR
jgi:hypothetical protein